MKCEHFLFFLLTSMLSANQIFAAPIPIDISSSNRIPFAGGSICSLHDTEVKCWDRFNYGTFSHSILNPTSVANNSNAYCVWNKEEVECRAAFDTWTNLKIKSDTEILDFGLGAAHYCIWEKGKKVQCECVLPHLCVGAEESLTIPNVKQISVGNQHNCALFENRVKCWGNYNMEFDQAINGVTEVSAGSHYSCAKHSEGVTCWDDKATVQIKPTISEPYRLLPGSSRGGRHNCVYNDHDVECWGDSLLADAKRIHSPQKIQKVVGSNNHVCVLHDAGVRCYGLFFDSFSSIPLDEASGNQIKISGVSCVYDDHNGNCWGRVNKDEAARIMKDFKEVGVGIMHVCTLNRDSKVQCVGSNEHGQLNVPAMVAPRALTVSRVSSCTIDQNEIKCWGQPQVSAEELSELNKLKGIKKIAIGAQFMCALHDAGIKCVGGFSEALDVPPISNPKHLTSMWRGSCAANDNEVVCWGLNSWARFPAKNVKQIEKTFDHTCMLDDNGVKCWGENGYGQLNVPELNNPQSVSVNSGGACAVEGNGRVKCWGEEPNTKTWEH